MLSYEPGSSPERGFSLSLRSGYGAQASGGASELLNRHTLKGLAANDNTTAGGRLEANLDYDLPVFSGRFSGTPWAGFGLTENSRDWRLGWRFSPAGRQASNLRFSVEAVRREGASNISHGLRLSLNARF